MKKDSLTAEVVAKSIVSLLTKSDKLELLPDVIFELEKSSHLLESALVTTPKELTSEEKKKVQKLVLSVTKAAALNVIFKVDPELLDGMQLVYKDKLWDLSLKTQINRLVKEM